MKLERDRDRLVKYLITNLNVNQPFYIHVDFELDSISIVRLISGLNLEIYLVQWFAVL